MGPEQLSKEKYDRNEGCLRVGKPYTKREDGTTGTGGYPSSEGTGDEIGDCTSKEGEGRRRPWRRVAPGAKPGYEPNGLGGRSLKA